MGYFEFFLAIFGLFAALNRRKLKKLKFESFPGVDSTLFSGWKGARLRANSIFQWATWRACLILIMIAIIDSLGYLKIDAADPIAGIFFSCQLGGLMVAGVYGFKAAKMADYAGIFWPPRKIKIKCPKCEAPLSVRSDLIGDVGICNKCKYEFEIINPNIRNRKETTCKNE